jgi:hypothetical protein
LDGIDAIVEAAVAVVVLAVVEPPTVNVVLTVGHTPFVVHDLK